MFATSLTRICFATRPTGGKLIGKLPYIGCMFQNKKSIGLWISILNIDFDWMDLDIRPQSMDWISDGHLFFGFGQ
jgi:hypothetical protein